MHYLSPPLQLFCLLYLFRGPVPKKRVHLGIPPGLSPVVRVTHALPDGSHQAAVLIAVFARRDLHDCGRHRRVSPRPPWGGAPVTNVSLGLVHFATIQP